jgi:alkylation response protein AidB-like acyl-CoA dehydrogenase
MQLELSDEQTLLLDTTVRFIHSTLPLDRIRDRHDSPTGFDPAWLQKAAELGWFAMLIPEALGGGSVSGAGLIDATIVAEALGRGVQPGPFVPMNVVASAVAAHGSDTHRTRVFPAISSGESVATWAYADPAGHWDRGSGLLVERDGTDLVLTGSRGFVQDALSAEWILAAALMDGTPVQVLVTKDAPGLTITALNCLDLSRRMANIDFDHVSVPATALLPVTGDEPLEAQLQTATVLNLADTVGAADALFAMTVAYSKDRVAFGRPIGSFQALKHLMADQSLYLESCRTAAAAAAWAVQNGDANASEVVSMTAAYVGDVTCDLAQECLQIHGGIGYTWEHDLHLFLRRIRSNSLLYGSSTWHRERVCTFHGLGIDRSEA